MNYYDCEPSDCYYDWPHCSEMSQLYAESDLDVSEIYIQNVERVEGSFCPKCPLKHRCEDGVWVITSKRMDAESRRQDLRQSIDNKVENAYRDWLERYGLDLNDTGLFFNTPEYHQRKRRDYVAWMAEMENQPEIDYAYSDFQYDGNRERGVR